MLHYKKKNMSIISLEDTIENLSDARLDKPDSSTKL